MNEVAGIAGGTHVPTWLAREPTLLSSGRREIRQAEVAGRD